jgi:hypothetical protein
MSDTELTLFWASEEVGETENGLLTAEVKAGGYVGHGSAWFGREFIRKYFVEEFRRHPITKDRPVGLDAGLDFDPKAVRLRISPHDNKGRLLVEVSLSAPAQSEHPMGDIENELTVRFVTNYEAILRFASAIEAQLDGGDLPSTLIGS